jgi:hypothetical protein
LKIKGVFRFVSEMQHVSIAVLDALTSPIKNAIEKELEAISTTALQAKLSSIPGALGNLRTTTNSDGGPIFLTIVNFSGLPSRAIFSNSNNAGPDERQVLFSIFEPKSSKCSHPRRRTRRGRTTTGKHRQNILGLEKI